MLSEAILITTAVGFAASSINLARTLLEWNRRRPLTAADATRASTDTAFDKSVDDRRAYMKRTAGDNDLPRRVVAELFGTLWLVLGGCGAAVLAAGFPNLGIGFLGVAFAFGLTVLTMAYAVGHISGGHFNPAVTVGLWSAGRCPSQYVFPYIIAQVIGAIVAALILWLIASGKPGWIAGGFAANGFSHLSPGKYDLGSCFITEIVMTFFFLFVIIGTTSKGAAAGFAGIPIGLALTLIHLVSIPVTNTSVNPARSTGPALFAGGEYISQLWLFWLAPIIGAVIAGLLARWMYQPEAIVETFVVEERRVTT
jgi:aquaporin Z